MIKLRHGSTKIILDFGFLILCLGLVVGCAGSKSRLKIGQSVDGEVVEAEGLAPYNAADIIATKRASLVDAQKNAVERAVGVFVSGKTLVEKAVAIENNILARTDGYVKKYDILKESREGDLYKTRIRALVAVKDLEKDLKQLSLLGTGELSRPRVRIKISEKVDKEAADESPAATGLEKQLVENGYVIVSGDDAGTPDLEIKGTATSYPFQTGDLGGFVSYRARMTVTVTRPGTTNVVLSQSKEASGLGGNPQLAGLKSLETVGNLTGEELAKQLAQLWSNKRTVTVTVEGVATFADVDRIKKHIGSQPQVSDLVLRSYDEKMAQFEVELGKQLQPSELASRLEASQALPLKVIEAKPQIIRLKAN
jgi:hypothetical protein